MICIYIYIACNYVYFSMYINIPSGHFAYEIFPIDSCPSGLSKSESRPVAGTISFGLLKGVKIDLVVDLPL